MSQKKPDFIIIGAAKAGTTTLHHYLTRHPRIFMSDPKEPTFFARDERYQRGTDWYLSLFANASRDQLCGEASTNYTNWPLYPSTVERMHALVPETRLIYLMRHPVDRAYSHYLQLIHNVRTDDPDYKFRDTFEQHIEKDDSVIQSSLYMQQIERFLERYPRDRLLLLFFEDFMRKPGIILDRFVDFLGLEPGFDFLANGNVSANINKNKEFWLVRSKLTAPLRSLPGGQWLADRLSKKTRDRIYALLSRLPQKKRIEAEYIPPKMLPETRARLLKYFHGPNEKLAQFLGTDLAHWSV